MKRFKILACLFIVFAIMNAVMSTNFLSNSSDMHTTTVFNVIFLNFSKYLGYGLSYKLPFTLYYVCLLMIAFADTLDFYAESHLFETMYYHKKSTRVFIQESFKTISKKLLTVLLPLLLISVVCWFIEAQGEPLRDFSIVGSIVLFFMKLYVQMVTVVLVFRIASFKFKGSKLFAIPIVLVCYVMIDMTLGTQFMTFSGSVGTELNYILIATIFNVIVVSVIGLVIKKKGILH